MKKNNFKRVMSALALTAVAASATSLSAFADKYTALDADTIAAAKTQPYATVTKKVITPADISQDAQQEITLTISGADMQYASTGFHIYYDSRLDIVKNKFGAIDVKLGEDNSELKPLSKVDPNAPEGYEGFFFTTSCDENYGCDGVLLSFKVTLKDGVTAKEGDVFPIDVIYKDTEDAADMFLNRERSNKDAEGWLFTKGIFSIENSNPIAIAQADLDACAGLKTYDKTGIDGYIAIKGGAVETTTTEAPVVVTTTTEAPVVVTTTTTEAPAVETTTTTEAPAVGTTTTTEAEDPAAGSKTTTTTGNGQNGANGTNTSTSTKKADGTTTKKADGGKKDESPKTGVAGVGVAAAGLAIAVGTAFALRKKED